VMDAATQRAIAYLGYRLKASERIEQVLADTVKALIETDEAGLALDGQLLMPSPLLGEERLRMPVEPPPKPVRTALRKREMTVHERAMHVLRKAMIAHRDTTPASIRRYVEAYVSPGKTLAAVDLPVEKVEDAVSYLVLSRLAGVTTRNPAAIRRNPLLRGLEFYVSAIEGQRADTTHFNTLDFKVTRRKRDAP
jgi:hypothetical protein